MGPPVGRCHGLWGALGSDGGHRHRRGASRGEGRSGAHLGPGGERRGDQRGRGRHHGRLRPSLPSKLAPRAPETWNFQPASTLAGATLGLFGFGGVALWMGRIALAMDMFVVALRRRAVPTPINGVEMVRSLSDLLSVTDHLVLAAPATELTRHVINADAFAMMRPGVHQIG